MEVGSGEWPFDFEHHGWCYVFDARSGMFYEPLTEFFYDTKTKIYYGNKKKAYYRYKAGQNPPFEEVFCWEALAKGESQAFREDIEKGESQLTLERVSQNPKIVINLKSTGCKGSSVEEPKPLDRAHIRSQKQPTLRKDNAGHKKCISANVNSSLAENACPQNAAASTSKVIKTARGEPICLLCMRKFPTINNLRVHEAVSRLHRENTIRKSRQPIRKAKTNKHLRGEEYQAILRQASETFPMLAKSTYSSTQAQITQKTFMLTALQRRRLGQKLQTEAR